MVDVCVCVCVKSGLDEVVEGEEIAFVLYRTLIHMGVADSSSKARYLGRTRVEFVVPPLYSQVQPFVVSRPSGPKRTDRSTISRRTVENCQLAGLVDELSRGCNYFILEQ